MPGTVQGHPKVGVMMYRSAGDWEVSSPSPDPDMQVAGDDAGPSQRPSSDVQVSQELGSAIPRPVRPKKAILIPPL